MPWTTITEPSLGLAVLKAVLEREGIPCRVLHVNLFMLEFMRPDSYHALAHIYTLNDFVFSGILDPIVTNLQQRALRPKIRELVNPRGGFDPMRFGGSEGVAETILRMRRELIPPWLERWADEIAHQDAKLVGFTCMFDQTIASLALGKMVKERAPNKMIVLGGYAVKSPTAEMIMRASPWIDAVCTGEGEITMVELARAANGEIPLSEVRGIAYRSNDGNIALTPPPPLINLNDSPTPNFDDYFIDVDRLSNDYQIDVDVQDLPIENSRGCWWGAKKHCTFCGISDADMAYRHRGSPQVLRMMAELAERHDIGAFRYSDYILPVQYFDTLLPKLVEIGSPYILRAEMKANITEDRFALLAKAGFTEVQPGIESFNSNILSQMDKGVSGVQNIFTLILGRRHGVRIFYNLIYGFPQDELHDYEEMVRLLPRLTHLDAPVTCVPVQITRWAPLQIMPQRFGLTPAPPEEHYELLFSEEYLNRTGFEIEKFCYYFERTFENSPALNRLYDEIVDIVTEWRSQVAERRSWLYHDTINGNGMMIHDKRGSEEEIVHKINGPMAEVLSRCGRPTSIQQLRDSGLELCPDRLARIIDELDALGLIFRDGHQFISLVLSGPPVDPKSFFNIRKKSERENGNGRQKETREVATAYDRVAA